MEQKKSMPFHHLIPMLLHTHRKLTLSALFAFSFFMAIIPPTQAQWVQTNGPNGAEVSSIGVFSSSMLVGTSNNGLFRSTDQGESWSFVKSDLISPNDAAIIFNSTLGSIVFAFDSHNGLLSSVDNGSHWKAIGSSLPQFSLTKNYFPIPGFGVIGPILIAGGVKGIFRSTDSGMTWLNVSALRISSTATVGSTLFAASDSGVSVSLDSGQTWTTSSIGLGYSRVYSVVAMGTTLFAASSSGIFRSQDLGASWDSVNTGLPNRQIGTMAVAGGDIYATCTNAGVFRSSNAGIAWVAVNAGLPNEFGFSSVTVLQASGTNLLAGTKGQGIFITTNEGNAWFPSDNGLTNTLVRAIAVSGTTLIAGTGDGISLSSDNGANWSSLYIDTGGFPVYGLFAQGPNVLVGTRGEFRSTDAGVTWSSAGLRNELVYSFGSIDGNIVASSDSGIVRSTNTGLTWTSVNAQLDSNVIGSFTLGGGVLYAGATYGIFRSTDSGKDWSFAAPMGSSVQAIISDGSRLLAGTYDRGVHLSTDDAANWIAASNGIPTLSGTTLYPVIYSFAKSDSTIFVATDSGIFLTTDGGLDWSNVSDGLTTSQIYSLALSGGYLFAGTINQGIWRRPLSEMIPLAAVKETLRREQISVQAYPNPFSSTTTINFTASASGFARITVVNLLGEQVARLYEGELAAGEHSFSWDASRFPAGTYFCIIRTPAGEQAVSVRHE